MGMRVNQDKSMLTPTQDFEFVGVHYLLAVGLALPPEERVSKMEDLFHRLLQEGHLPAELWQSLIGTVSSMMYQIPMGLLYLCPIKWHLALHWDQPTEQPSS